MGTICYYGEWPPGTLRELAANADWTFEVPAELLSTKKSIQALVEVCVSNGYGLGF